MIKIKFCENRNILGIKESGYTRNLKISYLNLEYTVNLEYPKNLGNIPNSRL